MKHYLAIDGQRTDEYGVSISGTGTFNAPARDMEAVAIPGKNGHMLLDNGRYENINVTYPAFMGGGFDSKIEAFRAFLLSDPGYRRLEDSYNPDEFRLGAYRGGFEAKTGVLNRAANFDLTFDCKPQRFLKSGEAWTPPAMACGSVGFKVPQGAGEVSAVHISTPYITRSEAFTVALIARPQPGSALADLESLLVDGAFYAAYIRRHQNGSDYTTTTANIRPSLVSSGEYSVDVAAGGTVVLSVFNAPGFDWFVRIGTAEYPLKTKEMLVNPTLYDAKPLIRFNINAGSSSYRVGFTLNGITIGVSRDYPFTNLFIDTELGDAYAVDYGNGGTIYNANEYVSLTDADGDVTHAFPVLVPGGNVVDFASANNWLYVMSESEIQIMPRWWTL